MKKLFALALILIYGVTSFGITVHLNYCCGQLNKVSFAPKVGTTCKFETSIHNRSCCADKEYQLKIKIDQEQNAKQTITSSQQAFVSFLVYTSNVFFSKKSDVYLLSTGPPVLPSATPLFIKYCVYRI